MIYKHGDRDRNRQRNVSNEDDENSIYGNMNMKRQKRQKLQIEKGQKRRLIIDIKKILCKLRQ